jgi:diacylglycerol kinase family enzyme
MRDTLSGGKLWIYVMRPQSRQALVWMLLKIAFGRFRGPEHFEIFQAEELYVESRSSRIGVALDGEVHVLESPLRYRILPRSLRVIVP